MGTDLQFRPFIFETCTSRHDYSKLPIAAHSTCKQHGVLIVWRCVSIVALGPASVRQGNAAVLTSPRAEHYTEGTSTGTTILRGGYSWAQISQHLLDEDYNGQ
jgi:hypothetical protein